MGRVVTGLQSKSVTAHESDNTINVTFTDEVYKEISDWCKERGLSEYALFKAVNLFLCDPINEECILRLLKSIELGNGAKAFEIDFEK